MSFNGLEVNGEKVADGERVLLTKEGPPLFFRPQSWWGRPASVEAFLIAGIIVALAVALALVVA